MNKTMKAAVMTGIEQMELREVPVPAPGPGQVLVKVEHVGICGSDLHYYESGRIGDFVVEPPYVLGHEAGGEVVALGEGVTGLAVGDKVAMEPGATCGQCEFCTTGRYNLCPDVVFFATPPVPGVFCEYVVHQAALCFKLPEGMGTMEGALIEPLAIGFYAALTGGAVIGQTAVVTGAGCIGLVSLLALKAMGLSSIIVTDVVDKRLDKALELGASAVVNAAKSDVTQAVLDLTGGRGADLVIETSGSEKSVAAAVDFAKKGTSIVLVGYPASGEMTLPVSVALNKELTFKTIFRYRHIYPLAIEAVASGKVDLKGIVSNIYQLDDIKRAMDESLHDKANVVKSVVKIG